MVRRGADDYELHIPDDHREILRGLPGQLREVMDSGHSATWRLFPDAYPDDPKMSAEFDRMTREDLIAGRKHSLQVMEQTVDATRLNGEQLSAWLGSLNDLRLFLGTNLDITEESYDEPLEEYGSSSPAMAIYVYLGWLEEMVVRALAADLPPGVDG
ncbi:MAG: DUF2017 family protein [Actinomycetota bacterium]